MVQEYAQRPDARSSRTLARTNHIERCTGLSRPCRKKETMKVYVIGYNGLGLAPTTPRKARILLKSGKAEVTFRQPFTIRLLYKTGCAHPELAIGIDTGSQHIGVAVVDRRKAQVLSKEEYELRSSMEKRKLLETRKTYRRGRRYRKTRYRHPKFCPKTKRVHVEKGFKKKGTIHHWKKETNEFSSKRQAGWLPPSIQSKLDHHLLIVQRYQQALPFGTKLRIEVGRFDAARMEDPQIRGEMYQKGPMYDYENVKAYVFSRDHYTCKCCKKKAGSKRKEDGSTVKLILHHVDFRSKGASDNPKRLATVCEKCHTAAAHKPGGILYEWMQQGKDFSRGYRDTVVMNVLRKRLMKAFPDAEFTYGNITAADRKMLGLRKSHANDAVAIAVHGMDTVIDVSEVTYYRQLRKQKRSLHEAIPRKGRKEPNRTASRNKKNTSHVGRIYLNDKVRVYGKTGWICGFSSQSSVYVKDHNGSYISVSEKKHFLIPIREVSVRTHCNNWGVCTLKTKKTLAG